MGHKLFIALSLLSSISCFAAEDRWMEGYGQGNLEYFIDKHDIRLSIGCPTPDGSSEAFSNVTLTHIDSGKQFRKFSISVNGMTFDGPFSASSRVGDNNFITLLDNLRRGDAIVKTASRTIKFSKSNAAKILPQYGNKYFHCNLFF